MTLNRFLLPLTLLCIGQAAWSAQPPKGDRELYAQTKALADKGDAAAQLRLAELYAEGTGVAMDEAKAAKWHRKAAEQGLARAQYQVASDYRAGRGVKPNPSEAFEWFRRAAEKGLPEAELALGLCYFDGSGVTHNGAQAFKWFRKAAGHDSLGAVFAVGLCYLEGTGVTKDTDIGVKWIRVAAEGGSAVAQNRLGEFCTKGEGVTRDYVQAYKWFALSASQDDERALDIRISIAKLEGLLTKEQVVEAQHLAHDFKPAKSPLQLPQEDSSSGPTAPTGAGSSLAPGVAAADRTKATQ
jgi:uncharacterized protein